MPEVKSQPTQSPALGEQLVLIDERSASRAVLNPRRGALISAFSVGGRELLYLDESTLLDPQKNVRGGIPVLFPSPGKLEGDAFDRAGRRGRLKQHGFARSLPWSVLQRASDADAARVTLQLMASAETMSAYPFAFRCELSFTLRGASLRLELRVHNDGESDLPFALGFHPYFRVDDKAHARIDTRATRAFDNLHKHVVPFAGFDFLAPELDLHLLDHGESSAALQLGDGARIMLRASEEFGLWVVWTLAGKPFICLEPWSSPGNALNSGDRLLALAPGGVRVLWVELELLPR